MCLDLKNSEVKVKIASKDIKCYKVIKVSIGGIYITPYQDYSIEIGETYKSELIRKYDRIERGLHTFKTLKDAKFEVKMSEKIIGGKYIIAECIIPKGSEYYEGTFEVILDVYLVSYASDTLTYVKIK